MDEYTAYQIERRLRRIERMKSTEYNLGEPMFFHHIAKTGGTSLIEALRAIIPSALAFSERGNLSAKLVEKLIARGLRSNQFIYGHPGTGAARPLRGRDSSGFGNS